MKQATLVKDNLENFQGHAAFYKLSEPIAAHTWDDDEPVAKHDYVVVSAAHVPFSGIETYIFPADESGNVTHWGELPGSQKGTLSHEDTLGDAGYEVVR